MAEIVDFGLQKHKIKMDSRYFDNVLAVVAGDTGRRIEVQLLDTNGMVQNTTGLSLRLNALIAGKSTFTDATLVDAATGKYQLDLSNGMFLAPGNWEFQWRITDSVGKKLHSFAFTGNVGSNISEGGSQATNFYVNLEDLKAMQEDLINGSFDSSVLETNITEKLTDLETQYAPKLTEVTAQLAQTNRWNVEYNLADFKIRDGELQNKLTIPTPYKDTNTEVVHPDIYYDKNGWGWKNHKYWMVITPYPGGDDQYEDPCIYCSNDGVEWIEPEGVVNPLEKLPTDVTDHNWHSDPCFYKEGNTLHIIYRWTTWGITSIRIISSLNGVDWSEPIEVLNFSSSNIQVASQAVVYSKGTYYMYFVDSRSSDGSSDENTLKYMTSKDLFSWNLSTVKKCEIISKPDNGDFWHMGIKSIDGILVMNMDFTKHNNISLFTSNNMTTFEYVGEDLVDVTTRYQTTHYKSVVDVFEKDGEKYLSCWIGTNRPTWDVYYYEIPFKKQPKPYMVNVENGLKYTRVLSDKKILLFGNGFYSGSGLPSLTTVQNKSKNISEYTLEEIRSIVTSNNTSDTMIGCFSQYSSIETDLNTFKTNYEYFISLAKVTSDVLIVIPNKRVTSSNENDYFAKRDIVYDLAKKNNIAVLDLEKYFGGSKKGYDDGFVEAANTPNLTSAGIPYVTGLVSNILNIVNPTVETGSFSYQIKGSTTVGTNTFNWGELGYYTKIGNMITFNIFSNLTFDSAIAGGLYLEGLPYLTGQPDEKKRGFTFPIGRSLKTTGIEQGFMSDSALKKVNLFNNGVAITGSDVAGKVRSFGMSGTYYI